MRALILVFLFVLGACIGSFLCCQVRRIHYRELHPSQKHLGNRSICLKCRHTLKWYDNIPLLSWFTLAGKCRYCHAKIGFLEPLSELALALAFLLLGLNFNFATASPLNWAIFLLSLLLVSILGFLAIYDAGSSELPTLGLIFSIICAAIILFLKQYSVFQLFGWNPSLIVDPLVSVIILSGVYLAFYLISKGKWVGDGDWILGLALGLAHISPWLSLLTLCLANLLACLIMIPLLYSSKKSRSLKPHTRIPLGPFLVAAFVIIYSCQNFFLKLL